MFPQALEGSLGYACLASLFRAREVCECHHCCSSAVVVEKRNTIVAVQHCASTAFDVTISHPLQKKYLDIAMTEAGVVAEEAHDRKLLKSLVVCQQEGIHFVPLAWESTGQVRRRRCMRLFASGQRWRVLAVGILPSTFAALCTLRFQ